MSRRICWALLFFALAAGPSAAVAPEVKDGGKFFSAEAVKKADDLLRVLSRRTGRDFLVETFASVPADKADKVKSMSREERSKFFASWAEERMNQAVVNGVYLLVCKDPKHLRVEVSGRARSVFDRTAEERLTKMLLEKFRNEKYDEGLLEAIKQVSDQIISKTK